jgi:hypothetical protein
MLWYSQVAHLVGIMEKLQEGYSKEEVDRASELTRLTE